MPSDTVEQQRWWRALECGAVGVWTLDPRTETVQYSPPFKARLGFVRTGSPDATAFWRSRVHPDDHNGMLRALVLHLRGFTPTYEKTFRLRDGDERYVSVCSRGRVVLRDEQGGALRMVGTMIQAGGRRSTVPRTGRRDGDGLTVWPKPGDDAWPLLAQIDDLLTLATREAGC